MSRQTIFKRWNYSKASSYEFENSKFEGFPMRLNSSRRQLLKVAAALHFTLIANAQKPASIVSVRDFGARGDGSSDDYAPIRAAFLELERRGGGTIVFPKGNYYVEKFISSEDVSGHSGFSIKDCKNVVVDLDGSTISVNGSFKRTADSKIANWIISLKNTVIPIELVRCRNVMVKNGVLRGGVQSMTKDAGVIEGSCHGISLTGCNDVQLIDLRVEYFAADGIYISGDFSADRKSFKASQNILITRVDSVHNGRQGMSIVGGRNITCKDCNFSHTGHTGGSYEGHAPRAGVDIEPLGSPPKADVLTGNIVFENCAFEDNRGFNLVATSPSSTDTLTCVECKFSKKDQAPEQGGGECGINPIIQNSRFDRCSFENAPVMPGYGLYGRASQASVVITNSRFVSKNSLKPILFFPGQGKSVQLSLSENTFSITPSLQSDSPSIWLRGDGIIFKKNKVNIVLPDEQKKSRTLVILRELRELSDNTWNVQGSLLDSMGLVDVSGSNHVRGNSFGGRVKFIGVNRS
jgi:hypothetical protein